MLDPDGALIYVGKAKSLRARLLSYFRRRSRDPKAGRILSRTRTIVWEPATSEFVALLRELELIQRWRPRFNIFGQPRHARLAFVCLAGSPAPYVLLSRKIPTQCVVAVGPVRPRRHIQDAVRYLNDLFRLRDCPQKVPMVFAGEPGLFADAPAPGCLRLELGACLGPCAAGCTKHDYRRQVRAAAAFLTGTNDRVLRQLEAEMKAAVAELAFERAAVRRDRLEALRAMRAAIDRVRQAQDQPPRIYETAREGCRPVWHVIQRGRVVATFNGPGSAEERRHLCARSIALTHRQRKHVPVAADELDEVLLIAAWFRKHPGERAATWPVHGSDASAPS
jgi:excinuclease ABC subunit C